MNECPLWSGGDNVQGGSIWEPKSKRSFFSEELRVLQEPSHLTGAFGKTEVKEAGVRFRTLGLALEAEGSLGVALHPAVVGAVEKRRQGSKKESVLVRGQEIWVCSIHLE